MPVEEIDNQAPVAVHEFLDDEVDTIANRQPVLTISVYDPPPSSGIRFDGIELLLDTEILDFEWDGESGSICYDFEWDGDTLDYGLYQLGISVPDSAGNVFEADGMFYIDSTYTDEPPFIEE